MPPFQQFRSESEPHGLDVRGGVYLRKNESNRTSISIHEEMQALSRDAWDL